MHLDFQILPLLLLTFVNLTEALMLSLLALLSFGVWDLLQHRMRNREVKHYVYRKRQTANGKRQTVDCCVSQKRENLRFSTSLTLLKSYSIYLVNRLEKSWIKSSFSVFWQKGDFILPFAVNVMLNLSINTKHRTFYCAVVFGQIGNQTVTIRTKTPCNIKFQFPFFAQKTA